MAQMKVLPSRPPQRIADALKEALAASQKTLATLNVWSKKNLDAFGALESSELISKAAKDTGLAPEEVSDPLYAIVNFGLLVEDEQKLADLTSDLAAIGLPDSALSNFRLLMDGLKFEKGKLIRRVWHATHAGIPRVVDSEISCDLRAIFDKDATDEDTNADQATNLQALVPVVILTLVLREMGGETNAVVAQFSEAAFARFNRSLANATAQLARITEIGKTASSRLGKG